MIHQRWSSHKRMALIPRNVPVCLLSGTKDQVVPFQHMETLWEISQRRGGEQKMTSKGAVKLDVYKEFSHGDHRKLQFYLL